MVLPERCPYPKKVKYESEYRAKKAAEALVAKGKTLLDPSVIRCPCGSWHVGRDWRPVQRRIFLHGHDLFTHVQWLQVKCWWCWREFEIGIHENEQPPDAVYCMPGHKRAAARYRAELRKAEALALALEPRPCDWCGVTFKPREASQRNCTRTHATKSSARRAKERRAEEAAAACVS